MVMSFTGNLMGDWVRDALDPAAAQPALVAQSAESTSSPQVVELYPASARGQIRGRLTCGGGQTPSQNTLSRARSGRRYRTECSHERTKLLATATAQRDVEAGRCCGPRRGPASVRPGWRWSAAATTVNRLSLRRSSKSRRSCNSRPSSSHNNNRPNSRPRPLNNRNRPPWSTRWRGGRMFRALAARPGRSGRLDRHRPRRRRRGLGSAAERQRNGSFTNYHPHAAVFNAAMEVDPRDANPIPSLATPEWIDRVTVRASVVPAPFHDGSILTAHDVVSATTAWPGRPRTTRAARRPITPAAGPPMRQPGGPPTGSGTRR